MKNEIQTLNDERFEVMKLRPPGTRGEFKEAKCWSHVKEFDSVGDSPAESLRGSQQ